MNAIKNECKIIFHHVIEARHFLLPYATYRFSRHSYNYSDSLFVIHFFKHDINIDFFFGGSIKKNLMSMTMNDDIF